MINIFKYVVLTEVKVFFTLFNVLSFSFHSPISVNPKQKRIDRIFVFQPKPIRQSFVKNSVQLNAKAIGWKMFKIGPYCWSLQQMPDVCIGIHRNALMANENV